MYYFQRGQILVLKSEELFTNTQIEYNKILEFLGINPYSLKTMKPKNVGKYKKENNIELRQELQNYYQPYNERLYEFLGEEFSW